MQKFYKYIKWNPYEGVRRGGLIYILIYIESYFERKSKNKNVNRILSMPCVKNILNVRWGLTISEY